MSNMISLSPSIRIQSNHRDPPLPARLQRVQEEHGHLRNLREADLEEKILFQSGSHGNKDGSDSDSEEVSSSDRNLDLLKEEDRGHQLQQIREALIRDVTQAQVEAMGALDLLSMLISGEKHTLAVQVLSPYLRDNIPLGTMTAATIVPDSNPPEVTQRRMQQIVSITSTGLLEAADFLSLRAARLRRR